MHIKNFKLAQAVTFLIGTIIAWTYQISPVQAAAPFTELVSISSSGVASNQTSDLSSISSDGRFVVFLSGADNLVSGDIFARTDNNVFLHDRVNGSTEMIDLDFNGAHPPAFSIGNLDNEYFHPAVSTDGRFVVFVSRGPLVPGDNDQSGGVYLRDRLTGTLERISVDSNGKSLGGVSPNITPDGRFITFRTSKPGNDVQIYLRDRVLGTLESIPSVHSVDHQITPDGRFIVFAGESDVVPTNALLGALFVLDRQLGTTERVDVKSNGEPPLANEVGVTTQPDISADGRFVAFVSGSSDLVPGDTPSSFDVFVHDRQTGTTELISSNANGKPAGLTVSAARISADGRFVVFSGDLRGFGNVGFAVYLRDRQTGTTELISININNNDEHHTAFAVRPDISADARYVSFTSTGPDLVPGVNDHGQRIFVRDRGVTGAPNSAGLSVTLADSPDPVTVGNPLTYTAFVTNNGSAAATDVQLSVTLPNGANFISASAGCIPSGVDVSCTIGGLAAGAQVNRSIVVAPTQAGGMNAQASVSAKDSANTQANTVTTVAAASGTQVSADLALTMSAPKSVKAGKNVLYTFTVKNKTKVIAPSVAINSQLPDTVTLLKSPPYCTVTGSQLACNLKKPLGKKKSKSFSIKVKTTTKGLITNTASVSSTAVNDTNLRNNTVSKSTKVK